MNTRVVVIGAGIGGLSTAALLSKAGVPVLVLESHIYPGGCAGTFYHQGYHFDAGATLAGGFYPSGPMDHLAASVGIQHWPAVFSQPAMEVHFPDQSSIQRWGDERRIEEHQRVFGSGADSFWNWQERSADALWNLALRTPAWPPQTAGQLIGLLAEGIQWLGADLKNRLNMGLAADAFRPLSYHLRNQPDKLRLFIDAQLLISAQTTSRYANALYGASALDLPRRGVVHMKGGMGSIAETLVKAIRSNGGEVLYRKHVKRIIIENGRPVAVELKRGENLPADMIIANLTPWNIAQMLGDQLPGAMKRLPEQPDRGWGAFMIYAGVDGSVFPENFPLHHQVIQREPFGEGNTIFISISPAWDASRAPAGRRAITISTHTDYRPWWRLYQQDLAAYEEQKQQYTDRVIAGIEKVIPGFRQALDLLIPGTPLSFSRFTHRAWGWVGGFPQTSLFQAHGPRILPGLWMVGDSIFPGQSTAAVALGGMRVAEDVLQTLDHQPGLSWSLKMNFDRRSG